MMSSSPFLRSVVAKPPELQPPHELLQLFWYDRSIEYVDVHNDDHISRTDKYAGQYVALDVPGDGSCWFHCLSLSIYGDFSHSEELRQTICGMVYQKWDQWRWYAKSFQDRLYGMSDEMQREFFWITMIENEDKRGWATTCELIASAKILNCNLRVWSSQYLYQQTALNSQT